MFHRELLVEIFADEDAVVADAVIHFSIVLLFAVLDLAGSIAE